MAMSTTQGSFPFVESSDGNESTVLINARCRLRKSAGYCVVTERNVVVAHYAEGDRMAEAYAVVSLVDPWERHPGRGCGGLRLFGAYDTGRHQRRFEEGGLTALGRPRGYPRGQPRLPKTRANLVNRLKAEGKSSREIARRLGVSEKAVRKLLRRLGWRSESQQLDLLANDADPKLSGLKEYNPEELGRLLGLDRVAEVKTIRRKLARLAGYGHAAEFGRALAEQRVQSRGNVMGFST